MPINTKCLHCNAAITAPEGQAGKKVKCPKCGQVVRLPEPQSAGGEANPPAAAVAKSKPVAKAKPAEGGVATSAVVGDDTARVRDEQPASSKEHNNDEQRASEQQTAVVGPPPFEPGKADSGVSTPPPFDRTRETVGEAKDVGAPPAPSAVVGDGAARAVVSPFASPQAPYEPPAASQGEMRVRIVDVDLRFSSVFKLAVKFWIAWVMISFLIGGLGFLLFLLLGGLLAALMAAPI